MILLSTILTTGVTAQIVDTSKTINAWKLYHNYSRFEDTRLDTSLFDLHLNINPLNRNGFAYERVGILGHAAQNLYVFDQPGTNQFIFGSAMEPYLANPDRTIFYNTRKPFTELIYSNMPGNGNEETVRFLHTQNMDPFTNIGIDFEVLVGNEFFINEDTRVTKFTLFGSRAKDKYSAFGTFHYNQFTNKENGGLLNPEQFRSGNFSDLRFVPVNLENALSGYTRLQIFYTQKFMISEKISSTDSLDVTTVTGKNISVNHQFNAERNTRSYEDQINFPEVPEFYDNFYYFNDEVKDSVMYDRISNTIQFVLGDPYTDKLSARVYAGHEFTRYGQRSPEKFQVFSHFDTVSVDPLVLDSLFTKDTASAVFHNNFFNELFVGFHMAGPPGNKWYWNMDGKYYVAGYYRNNFKVNATFSRQIFNNYRLGLSGKIENSNVSYFHNHYSSAFFRWDNDFNASQLMRGEAFLTNDEQLFDAVFSAGIWTNYLYWDENALPAQYESPIYLVTGKLRKHFKIAGFNSRTQLLVQYTTAEEVLRLPLVAMKTSNYWEQDLFKGALKAQIGIDLYITTPYLGNAYMPATGVFYLQNSEIIGGFPFAGAFLNLRIKRTRIFGSYNNGFAGILNNNYFTAANYPTKPGFFRFGLAWTFYD